MRKTKARVSSELTENSSDKKSTVVLWCFLFSAVHWLADASDMGIYMSMYNL